MTDRFKLLSINEVLNEPSPEWRVEGLLPVGGLSMIYAPQAQFKTFFSLDLALSVAGGSDFHGRSVKQGPTVYILGEGRSGLKNRITAWLDEHKTEEVPEVFFVLDAVQFKRPEDVKALSSQIDGMSIKPAMLFIDTFARSAVGLDENNATDVGLWVDAVAALQRDLKVDVVAVHHAQKGQSKNKAPRERGSSAFIGAVDTVIRLDRPSQTRTTVKVRCEKQKDAEEFEPFLLTVKVVSLGKNEHGEQASSCVLVDGPFEIETESNAPETHEYELLLALRGSPNGTATRKELLQRTALTKRTLDRNRDSLQKKNYIESTKHGVFRITEAGVAAIASLSPCSRDGNSALDVAATPHTPVRGGVATGVAIDYEEPEDPSNFVEDAFHGESTL